MFFKTEENDYIICVGTGIAGEEITEEEYNIILASIESAPKAPSGYEYRLRASDLEWELVELPPEPEPELDPEEALSILLGGDGE